jgi:hypothetical protein
MGGVTSSGMRSYNVNTGFWEESLIVVPPTSVKREEELDELRERDVLWQRENRDENRCRREETLWQQISI